MAHLPPIKDPILGISKVVFRGAEDWFRLCLQ